jgi:hypothetical protein
MRSVGHCAFLLFEAIEMRASRLRNFDTKLRYPYCYRFDPRQSLGERRQRAHRRRFARPPRSLIRAGLKSLGRCERIKRYIKPYFPQRKDSARLPAKTTSRSPGQPAHLLLSRKVLNLCEDSKRRDTVTFLPVAQNKFINRLRSNESEAIFPTTDRHYADK